MILRTKGIIVLVIILALVGVLIGLKTIKHEPQTLWQDFRWNGNTLNFSYPKTVCFSNGTDCLDLYVVHTNDAFIIGSMRPGEISGSTYIDPILTISYVDSIDFVQAEQYLQDIYIKPMMNDYRMRTGEEPAISDIQWVPDGRTPLVKVMDSSMLYAAYSEQMRTLVAFQLQPACLFDCQIDQDVLHSITLDGVQVYSDAQMITLPVQEDSDQSFAEMITDLDLQPADQVLHDPVYHNTQFGFSFTVPETWTTYAVRTVENRVFFGIPLESPEANGQMFDVWYVDAFTPDQWEVRMHECDRDEPMCFLPDKLGQSQKYVFGGGPFIPAAGGFTPCYGEVETREAYFCAVFNDLFVPENEGSYDVKSLFTVP